MKKYISGILLALVLCSSCSESFLDENPQSFESAEQTYKTTKGFNAALNGLFAYSRLEFETWNDNIVAQGACAYEVLQGGLDICYVNNVDGTLKPFQLYTFDATNSYIANRWKWAYGLITNANMMNNYAEKTDVTWTKETDKIFFQANARFFRAYAYRYLTYLYGDVPWVDKVEDKYRLDFERTPKAEVLKKMIEDLEFAAKNLPENPNSVKDGELTKWAALHMLSEICIFAGDYKKAETVALEVINSSYYKLMDTRFGKDASKPGDAFADMFLEKNQNRKGGNLESIWVVQAEYNVQGGSTNYNDWTRRAWVPGYYNIPGFQISQAYGGRGLGQIRPIEYVFDSYEPLDMRNSAYNIRREFFYNDPKNTGLFGKKHTITEDNMDRGHAFPTTTKFDYMPENAPTYEGNQKDKMRSRLAETYLLLAEAYIKDNQIDKAAEAINKVRARAGATAVKQADVNIDYLLDERARELLGEEMRRFTLVRTGKLVERTKKYNSKSAAAIKDHHVLWPVPQGVIDSNSGLKWENNPGYN
ncbi:putative outer membrane starch-binding protein [Dysgonomonas alginatilytica]|uniref:Putative outer membrane starch-binding protein n=1 Tax=Dysgonomonas alginatilytica TaxID=1605892 RepID=A0A2V3PTT7_9BACT|nr:RagB/SusD family nutrient uptake outer membrane protein [Dysgonomonas alginatilytica]PXV69120.1 putative outer membrane starch-binding protein [Dysgonomonas alginatilytica]